ncbi:TPA: carboxyltransferase domain-containing protein [Vibrio parahaemolyticus]|nr:carboxyltransferase domain-containing protein [Vibrio parahaemolyticus]
MRQTKFSIDLVSECSILIRFDETISENSIGQLARAMNQHLSHIVMNIVPSYRTVLIDYVEESITMPRLKTPRTFVPSGSVGIADSKTAVYPSDSPGGWNIIGRSPLSLFSDTPPFIPFEVGDKVTFYAVSKQEFLELGGAL